jgi:hypothetical protein
MVSCNEHTTELRFAKRHFSKEREFHGLGNMSTMLLMNVNKSRSDNVTGRVYKHCLDTCLPSWQLSLPRGVLVDLTSHIMHELSLVSHPDRSASNNTLQKAQITAAIIWKESTYWRMQTGEQIACCKIRYFCVVWYILKIIIIHSCIKTTHDSEAASVRFKV